MEGGTGRPVATLIYRCAKGSWRARNILVLEIGLAGSFPRLKNVVHLTFSNGGDTEAVVSLAYEHSAVVLPQVSRHTFRLFLSAMHSTPTYKMARRSSLMIAHACAFLNVLPFCSFHACLLFFSCFSDMFLSLGASFVILPLMAWFVCRSLLGFGSRFRLFRLLHSRSRYTKCSACWQSLAFQAAVSQVHVPRSVQTSSR